MHRGTRCTIARIRDGNSCRCCRACVTIARGVLRVKGNRKFLPANFFFTALREREIYDYAAHYVTARNQHVRYTDPFDRLVRFERDRFIAALRLYGVNY